MYLETVFINTRAVLIGGNPNCASVYPFHDCRLGVTVTANTSSALSINPHNGDCRMCYWWVKVPVG